MGSFVAASTAVTANYAGVTPTLPTGTQSGDLVFILASVRSSGTGQVVTPSGWTRSNVFGSTDNVQLFQRTYNGSWSMPVVTFSGGATGDDVLVQAATFRDVTDQSTNQHNTILNSSAQNITLPTTVTATRGSALVLYIGWKQDDFTSTTAVAGTTKIADISSTAGNDAGMTWSYAFQGATAAATTTGSITVTGGASAISRAGVAVYLSAVAIDVTEQDTWPVRTAVAVTGLSVGDNLVVYRSLGGTRTIIRGGTETVTTDPGLSLIDAELPFGVPITYGLILNGSDGATAGPTTYTLVGGKVALTDAISGQSAELVLVSEPSRTWDSQSSVFKVGGRTVVVSNDFGMFTSEMEFLTETTSSADNLETLLRTCTQGVLQLRQAGPYDGVDAYISVLTTEKQRYTDRGEDNRRIWMLSAAEVESWSSDLVDQGFTYADLEAYYTGSTYVDLANDYIGKTYLDLAVADLS